MGILLDSAMFAWQTFWGIITTIVGLIAQGDYSDPDPPKIIIPEKPETMR